MVHTKWTVYKGKSESKMDDKRGTPMAMGPTPYRKTGALPGCLTWTRNETKQQTAGASSFLVPWNSVCPRPVRASRFSWNPAVNVCHILSLLRIPSKPKIFLLVKSPAASIPISLCYLGTKYHQETTNWFFAATKSGVMFRACDECFSKLGYLKTFSFQPKITNNLGHNFGCLTLGNHHS